MKKLLGRLFGTQPARDSIVAAPALLVPAPPLILKPDASFPIVDWDAMDAHAPETSDRARLDAFWSSAAAAWLKALSTLLGEKFTVRESEHFLLLGPLDAGASHTILKYCERSRRQILHVLDGMATETEIGKLCVLILDDQEQYYNYVSNYHQDGEHSLSGGSFIQSGYGHFVFVKDDLSAIEPTIAHELTHSMLQHLSLPLWLDEGIAVNTERRLSPPLGLPLHSAEEMHEKHLAFWNAQTIQQFWSGRSWRRHDDGNMLSYDLARHFVSMAANDRETFRAFVNAADWQDGADAAAREHLGYPVAHLAEAVLGEGAWTPAPDTWAHDAEKRASKSYSSRTLP